ncbi:MAG: hypothetical protein QOE70_850 [Chthoniobacter sp.]|jgi:hypothetical protein|nr:hypothetical protein [Chthoniobacter sp.]
MSFDADTLYGLLPSVYRVRDAERGEPQRALLAVIAEQVGVLEEDLDQLYDNQFIETCAPWVLPYIGDLIGYRSLHPIGPNQLTPRAEVANHIGYLRRKGTISVLEQLARDVTGWNARAVEFFQLLATTQCMNHVRPTNFAAPDLRQWEPLERLGSAFETTARTVDVRHIERGEGKYNIPNIGIFFWRLTAFRLRGSPAVGLDDRRFLFHPLGANRPLFTRPQTEGSITHLAEPLNVPAPISRRVLDASLAAYYGPDLSLFIGGVPLAAVRVCNLSDADPAGSAWAHTPPAGQVAIDPVLGRLSFGEPPAEPPLVTFHYGFSAAMGGGEYERSETFDAALAPIDSVPSPGPIQPALDAHAHGGVVELSDSGRFQETPALALDPGVRLEVRAADEHRPTLIAGGPIEITGGADAEVTLNGLLIAGGAIRVPGGSGNVLRKLRLVHCTLVPGLTLGIDGAPGSPGEPSLLVEQTESPIEIEIDHCIVGAIRAPSNATVLIRHSIVDANRETAVAYAAPDGVSAGGTLSVVNCTVIGTVHTGLLKLASNSIFLARTEHGSAPVRSGRQQAGCVRFSWLPLEARVPRRYRCQPDLEIAEQTGAAVRKSGLGTISAAARQAIQEAVVARLVPAFTSLRSADAGYGQLRISCPPQIRTGADDEAEMGAFHDLFQPQRESNVRARLRESLRFGLEAGLFFET